MRQLIWLLVIFFVVVTGPTAFAKKYNARFSGFKKGDTAVSFILGEPTVFRYQKWNSWNWATFYDFGYQYKDEILLGAAGLDYYFSSEDDRWRNRAKVGTILFNSYLAVIGGHHIGDDNEKTRLGIKAGGAFEYLFPASDLALRFEAGPTIYVSGKNVVEIHGGVGLVYQMGSSTPKTEGISVDGEDGFFVEGEGEFEGVFDDDEPVVKKKRKRRSKKRRKARARKKKKTFKKKPAKRKSSKKKPVENDGYDFQEE